MIALLGAAFYFFVYVPRHKRAGEPVFVLPSYVLTFNPIRPVGSPAYVLPGTLEIWNTPAIIRSVIATLKAGDQVYVLGRFRDWDRVRLTDGRIGWVAEGTLMDERTHAADEQLLKDLTEIPPQAAARPGRDANVRLDPSRDAPLVAQLNGNDEIEIYGRRMVERPTQPSRPGGSAVPAPLRDAWYLVRTDSRAGWVLGRLVDLDIPSALERYAQGVNLVAWLVLNQVNDNGRQVPQYVVADRVGTESADFTHIRVLTWWQRKQTYAVAYVEGSLEGYFPILVSHQGATPQFRLRLVDSDGKKYQKVYGLFDTITRAIGTVDGWEIDAAPEPLSQKNKRAGGVR